MFTIGAFNNLDEVELSGAARNYLQAHPAAAALFEYSGAKNDLGEQVSPALEQAIRTSDTRYFVDPSIATAALGVGPGDLINDLETCGLFFETLCIRDLRVYTEALDGSMYHFRTKEGLGATPSFTCATGAMAS